MPYWHMKEAIGPSGVFKGRDREEMREISIALHDFTVTEFLPPERERKTGSQKVDRIEPCPCGSGKKYKKCHGA
jgi:uncharacterized protein YchJ